MNTLLRIYLVLIFVGSAMNAGPENDSNNSGIPLEASNFAKPSYPKNLQGIADCLNSEVIKEYKSIKVADVEKTFARED